MINKEPSLRTIIDINGRFIAAMLALFYGWLCWQWASPEWWGLGPIAILCFIGGGTHMIATIFKVVAIIRRRSAVRTFERQGGKARADHMAGERDLKDRGMIR
ncbi:hypothetical protein GOZ96_12350 [Agrobacterium vitis]|uniref:Transmembrane protein n=1 Tax=Agrobacterium vitis TaxID=373 RepID=A0A368NP02_AGRVI|nr:hypothetical protein [Agrobacterium vitis]KAA3516963.1 hypothetical protein DXM22_10945 [Agrobacterium vitis]KAA3529728.1 hypothetical protein DXT89_08470 [Agrobacterium vitis]MUZ97393.1 hypothetical protein [Agrobacterium vitis]NOJ36229.1 hypothetical protein [Agrobacterium vitis]RCU52282.1 hypothetical protein ASB66_019305 [Agrobacterium vitis]